MAEAFFDFEWPVAPDYVWADWFDDDGKPVLPEAEDLVAPHTSGPSVAEKGKEVGPILTPVEGPSKVIRPMSRENATLFRVFADLDARNAGAILNFVRHYGWLGKTPRPFQVRRLDDGSLHHAEGEAQLTWAVEIAMMREAIRGWERGGGKPAKNQEDKWRWLFDSHLQDVQGRMTLSPDGSPELRIAPMNLLAAMWLQLAMAVAGNKQYVRCKFCQRQIEISTAESGFRTNRQFCGNSCKTKDYRRRKRAAQALWKAGRDLGLIQRKVKTDLKTVTRWVAGLHRRTSKGRLGGK